MEMWRRKQRMLAVALAVALLASLVLVVSGSVAVTDVDVLTNGGFEGGFNSVAGCGMVGKGWGCFTRAGTIVYGFYDDQWDRVVASGKHSQLIELNTMQYPASEPDRYAGIYQRVNVVKNGKYQLKVSGLMRERGPDATEDKFRYRIQWGYTSDGSTDWGKVTNWVELPWDTIYERTNPGAMQHFSTSFIAPSNRITLFLRVWKKWGTAYKELDVNLDAISLVGPRTGTVVVPVPPARSGGGAPVVVPPARPGGSPVPVIIPPGGGAKAGTCTGTNYVKNGSFESGFSNGVGKSWMAFNNGGMSTFGYADDTWSRVVHDGSHAQLLKINTSGMAAADPNRVAGIYQVVGGLTPGQTYEFSLWGEMREEAAHPNEDAYRYRVEWGWAAAGSGASWKTITNWTELPWDNIYVQSVGGSMSPFSAQFKAPSSSIVIGVRALKKWGTVGRELDVDLDAIRLARCGATGKPPVIVVPPPTEDGCTWYTVKRGDYLNALARTYGTSLASIMAANPKITNPNRIYPGQVLCIR